MRVLFRKLLLFFTILIGIFLAYNFLTVLILTNKAKFFNQNDINIVFFGHSHSECAYNDSIILNSKNFSSSGESYFYTFQKAKEIFSYENQVKTVFIEFTNNQIEKQKDIWIWGNKQIYNNLPVHHPFISLEDYLFLFYKNPKGFLNTLPKIFKHSFLRIAKCNFDYSQSIGSFRSLNRNSVDSLLSIQKQYPVSSVDSTELSDANLYYLRKTIDLIKSKNVQILLVRSPQHKNYSGFYNELKFQTIREERFSDVEFLDLAHFPLKNSEFGDFDHLNHQGARVLSEWFQYLIKNSLLEIKDIDDFINLEIKKEILNFEIKNNFGK